MNTLAVLIFLYFLPSIVAAHRGHTLGGILILNFLFGWTGIGWLALLFWALVSRPARSWVPVYQPCSGWRRY